MFSFFFCRAQSTFHVLLSEAHTAFGVTPAKLGTHIPNRLNLFPPFLRPPPQAPFPQRWYTFPISKERQLLPLSPLRCLTPTRVAPHEVKCARRGHWRPHIFSDEVVGVPESNEDGQELFRDVLWCFGRQDLWRPSWPSCEPKTSWGRPVEDF